MCEKCVAILDEVSDMTYQRAADLHTLVMGETERLAASREDGDVDLSNVMELTTLKILSEIQSGQAWLLQAHANLMARLVNRDIKEHEIADLAAHFGMEGEEEE